MNTNSLDPPLTALKTLSLSENIDYQRRAAVVFTEITKQGGQSIKCETLDAILHLLDSRDASVQEAARASLQNLAMNGGYFLAPAQHLVLTSTSTAGNQPLTADLGDLEDLVRLMQNPSIVIQRYTVGCISELARHGMI